MFEIWNWRWDLSLAYFLFIPYEIILHELFFFFFFEAALILKKTQISWEKSALLLEKIKNSAVINNFSFLYQKLDSYSKNRHDSSSNHIYHICIQKFDIEKARSAPFLFDEKMYFPFYYFCSFTTSVRRTFSNTDEWKLYKQKVWNSDCLEIT